ncbi:MAG TPA: hypothetical protein VF676_02670 [Flavobacterium sp.]|jgi:GTPase SAR1 family protein
MRLAILIIGAQNSGKTSTIKHLISVYNGRKLKVMKAGWKDIFLNPVLKSMRLNFFCVPASPTETGIKLSTRFLTMLPEVLVVAEQDGGANYPDTMSFLATSSYSILRYDIQKTNGSLDWERFDTKTMTSKLDNRTDEIVTDIKTFLKTNGIV